MIPDKHPSGPLQKEEVPPQELERIESEARALYPAGKYNGSYHLKRECHIAGATAEYLRFHQPISHVEGGEVPGWDFQIKVSEWLISCFGFQIAKDKAERNYRFLEEAMELVQANGCLAESAHALVDYVWGRPEGELKQECGGVMVTLAALCFASHISMDKCGNAELNRIWGKIEQIREKQAAKKIKSGPLP